MESREDSSQQTRPGTGKTNRQPYTAVNTSTTSPAKHLGYPLPNPAQAEPRQPFTPISHDDNWPINYDFVRDHLGSLMDELMPELIQTFLQDGAFRLTQLQASMRSNDWQQIWKAAHSLKGSSATLGMLAFSGLCLQLESAAKCEDWDTIHPLTTHLHTEFTQIQLFLTAA